MGFFASSGILNRRGFFGGTTAAPFSPSDISGLQLWLDATTGLFDATSGGSAVTTDGSAVARWEDQSGNGNHATQGTSNNRPILKTSIQNSKNVVRFDGSNDRLTCGDVLDLGTNDISIFIVCKITNASAGLVGKSRAAGNEKRYSLLRENSKLYFLSELQSGATNLNTYPEKTSDTSSAFRLLTASYKRLDGRYLRINKSATANVSSGNDTGSWNTAWEFLIGAYQNSTGDSSTIFYPLNGDICEIIVYIGTALTGTQRDNVETYLYDKWGIT